MGCWLIILLATISGSEDVLAYVAEDASGAQRVMTVSLASDTLHAVGSGPRDGAPVWAPGGTQLAFETQTESGRRIAVAEQDGSGLRMLDVPGEVCFSPAWSPNADRIAYSRTPLEGDALAQTLCVQDLETERVEVWGGGRPGLLRPQWMPNALFLGVLQGVEEIEGVDLPLLREEVEQGALWCVLLRADESGLHTEPVLATKTQVLPLMQFLTRNERAYVAWTVTPHVSGTRLAFESDDGGDREIFVLTEKGLVDVSNHRAADWNPVWAPRDRQLLFESFRQGSRGVYRVFADTARVTVVASDPRFDCWAPAWAPDGRRVAYVSNRTGAPEIYVDQVAGGEATPLAAMLNDGDGAHARLAPAWRPEVALSP
jgi:Tol biopolymer transport system component